MILNNYWLLLKMKKDNSKILDQGIAEITSRRHTLEEWLSLHPDEAEELRPLLEIALNIRKEDLSPSPQFKEKARQRLWQEMEKPTSRFSFITTGFSIILRPFHSLKTVALVVPLFLVLGFGSALNSSRSSLPDDTLYGLKTGMENLNMTVTMDPVKKSDLRISLVERRIDEVIIMNQSGRAVSQSTLDSISAYLEEALYQGGSESPQAYSELMDRFYQAAAEQKQKLEDDADANQSESSSAIKQVYAMTQLSLDLVTLAKTNPEILRSKICLAVPEIEDFRFSLSGKLIKGQNGTWTINGQELSNLTTNYSTKLTDGATVKVKGIRIAGSSYVTGLETNEDSDSREQLAGLQAGNDGDVATNPTLEVQSKANHTIATGSETESAESFEIRRPNDGLNASGSTIQTPSPKGSITTAVAEHDSD
jgi:ElaB/YqjD/DUF883 family membrane-anchored ribosome-binding protein